LQAASNPVSLLDLDQGPLGKITAGAGLIATADAKDRDPEDPVQGDREEVEP
jgi:hypothetical protein